MKWRKERWLRNKWQAEQELGTPWPLTEYPKAELSQKLCYANGSGKRDGAESRPTGRKCTFRFSYELMWQDNATDKKLLWPLAFCIRNGIQGNASRGLYHLRPAHAVKNCLWTTQGWGIWGGGTESLSVTSGSLLLSSFLATFSHTHPLAFSRTGSVVIKAQSI